MNITTTHPPAAIANFFLQRGMEDERPVDPMKLQKLIYFAHGWNLAVNGEPLIDEKVEAWKYGPVTPTIYHAVKANGSGPIEALIYESDEAPKVTDGETRALLERVWQVYGDVPSMKLSHMSHDPEGPWYSAWHERAEEGRRQQIDIPDDEIRSYFLRIAGHPDGNRRS